MNTGSEYVMFRLPFQDLPYNKEERKDLNRFVWYLLTYECVCNEKLLALKFVKSDRFFPLSFINLLTVIVLVIHQNRCLLFFANVSRNM